MKVLAKGLNFAVFPNKILTKEIVTAVACQNLELEEAGLLRNQVVGILQNSKPPKPNMTKDEIKALNSLKNNKHIVILPADKGKAVVIMNKVDYVKEYEKLLVDKDTYTPLSPNNPTKTLKERLQRKLRPMKKEGHLDPRVYLGKGKGTPYLTSEVPLLSREYSPRKPTVRSFYPPLFISAPF